MTGSVIGHNGKSACVDLDCRPAAAPKTKRERMLVKQIVHEYERKLSLCARTVDAVEGFRIYG